MSLPDFLIVGAMKCGTSTLAAQLGAQPGIFMTTPKEPNFFSDDEIHAKGEAWYRTLFADAAPGDLKGEASTHYTKLPSYPETLTRMQALLPAPPRIVYMIRNPVARAISHYIHDWSIGEAGSDIRAAFDTHPNFVDYGCYGMQIAPFVEAFGADRVYLTCLEAVSADPAGELDRIGAFLGYEGTPAWQKELARENASAERSRKLPMHGLLVDNPVATALRRALVPKSLRTWIRKSRTIGERPDLPDDLRAQIEAAFSEDREALTALFHGHPALDTCYPFARA